MIFHHPEGELLVRYEAGSLVTNFMDGHDFLAPGGHPHTGLIGGHPLPGKKLLDVGGLDGHAPQVAFSQDGLLPPSTLHHSR